MDVVGLREDRALGVGADDEQVGLLLLEVARGAGDRAARADGEDERVDLPTGLLPELGPGRLVVRLRVGQVRVLVGLERARDLLGEPVRDRVVALGRVRRDRGRADDDLGAVGAQKRTLLLGNLVRHDEDAAVALERGRDGEADAGVPARGLDDRPARRELSVPLGLLDHRRPIRSFTLPPGFRNSSLARSVGSTSCESRCRRTSGVFPTRSRTVGWSPAIAVTIGLCSVPEVAPGREDHRRRRPRRPRRPPRRPASSRRAG